MIGRAGVAVGISQVFGYGSSSLDAAFTGSAAVTVSAGVVVQVTFTAAADVATAIIAPAAAVNLITNAIAVTIEG